MPYITAIDYPLRYAAVNGSEIKAENTLARGTTVISGFDLPYAPEIGARGYGAWSPKTMPVVVVSSLADAGPGTLREALETGGNRLILFAVAGTIRLGSRIKSAPGDVWIDGTAAPEGGVCVAGGTLVFSTDRVMLRHLRLRLGVTGNPGGGDCLTIKAGVSHCVIDHCSLSWSTDELIGLSHNQNVTISNCILSEALSEAGHPDGEHSKAVLCFDTDNVSIMTSLFVSNIDRNPTITRGNLQLINCVSYNCSWHYIAPDNGPVLADIVGNIFIAGPDSQADYDPKHAIRVKPTLDYFDNTRLYFDDNALDGYLLIRDVEATGIVETTLTTLPDTLPAEKTLAFVLVNAGAFPRDAVDMRIVNDVINRTGRIIDDPAEVGGWPDLTADTDAA